jgi:spectinomycin phosphotransferase
MPPCIAPRSPGARIAKLSFPLTLAGMKAIPDELDADALAGCVVEGWGFEVVSTDYAPVGRGSYHWVMCDRAGARRFVTVDDLESKPWLGDAPEMVFDGLRRAFDSALALRENGLRFVVSPLPTHAGETLRRVGARYTVALFPYLNGHVSPSGKFETADDIAAVVSMLAALHEATPAVGSAARRFDIDLPSRAHLESALRDVNTPWSGGPFSEPARQAVAAHASDLADMIALADRLVLEWAGRGATWVVTHGEPHARNVMRVDGSHILLDWDTVALAPPERDLWMLVGDAAGVETIYAEATGHRLDPAGTSFFRLAWDLGDLAVYLRELRSPHRHTEDTETSFERLQRRLTIRNQWAAMLA